MINEEILLRALKTAVAIADLARKEWDAAPDGMRAGKLLIALSGHCPGYRSDIDAIHAAIAAAERGFGKCEHGLDRALCGQCSIHLEVK